MYVERSQSCGRVAGAKLKEADPDKFPEGEFRFSEQEGFYLTRSFRLFKQPKWRAAILDLENKQFRKIREDAAKALIEEQKRILIDEEITERNIEATNTQDMGWLTSLNLKKRLLRTRMRLSKFLKKPNLIWSNTLLMSLRSMVLMKRQIFLRQTFHKQACTFSFG